MVPIHSTPRASKASDSTLSEGRPFPTSADALNRVMRRSVEYAFANRTASLPYVRAHAQEMSEEVMYKHIDLYVNQYSVDLGPEGRRAIELMFARANTLGLIPKTDAAPFLG